VAIVGIEAIEVQVQIEIVKTIPSFVIVGMVNRGINESKERIRGVFNSCNLSFPNGKIIVNLCPADIIKEGSHYDLPIIVGLLQGNGIIKETYEDVVFFGELSLDGEILKTKDILSVALFCYRNNRKIIVHESYYGEMVEIFQEKSHLILIANNLWDIIKNQFKTIILEPKPANHCNLQVFQDIMGHSLAKKIAAVSLIGRHNILFFGPPGSGKSLISKSLAEFNLPLDQENRLIVSSIYGKNGNHTLVNNEPFRHPHHSASYVSLLGGGTHFKPGEVSLAHRGILFLDEIAEFNPSTLDMLRQAMEDKQIVIGRAQYNITMPCDFQLVAAMNPCKCGYWGDKKCICSVQSVQNYQKKISGPLMDRIDIRWYMGYEYEGGGSFDDDFDYYDWVMKGRAFTKKRQENGWKGSNNNIKNNQIDQLNFNENGLKIIDDFCKKNNISLRRKLKILGVARSLADGDQSWEVGEDHCLQSLAYTSKCKLNPYD
jgi:magnesium chelatase family protein